MARKRKGREEEEEKGWKGDKVGKDHHEIQPPHSIFFATSLKKMLCLSVFYVQKSRRQTVRKAGVLTIRFVVCCVQLVVADC